MIDVREYSSSGGQSPFAAWFDRLNAPAAARVTTAITRVASGNFSNVKGVGSGVFECRIDFGPGYRVYFGRDGERLIILLAGGIKKRQQRDIQESSCKLAGLKRSKVGISNGPDPRF